MNSICVKNTFFIITGLCGVGKSTISQKLAEQFDLSCHINADLLYHMVVGGYIEPWKDNGTKLDLLWRNIGSLVKNFSSENYTVVLDYIVFPEHLKYIEGLNLKVKYVVLISDKDTIRKRDLLRPEDEVMGERAIEFLEEFREKSIDSKYLIETSTKSIEQVVDIIIKEDRFIID